MTDHAGDRLSAYVDGELHDAERAAVAAHLDGCASCRAELAAVSRARTWLRALPPVPPGPVALRLPSARAGHRWLAAGAAAAAVAAIVGLGTTVGDGPRVTHVTPYVKAHAGTAPSGDPATEMGPVVVPVALHQ